MTEQKESLGPRRDYVNTGLVLKFKSLEDKTEFNKFLIEMQERGIVRIVDIFVSRGKLFVTKASKLHERDLEVRGGDIDAEF